MLINVKKILIYGLKEEVDNFFKRSQNLGFIEFINKSGDKVKEISPDVKNFVSAIKILKKEPLFVGKPKEQYLSAKDIVTRVLNLNTSIEHLLEEQRILRSEIMRIFPYGNFSKKELELLEKESHRVFQFFCIKTSQKEEMKIPEELIYISTLHDLDYFVAINKEKVSYHRMIEIIIDKPLGVLRERLSKVQRQIHIFYTELKELTAHLKFLKEALLDELNKNNLDKAKKEIALHMEGALFAIEAWIPENKIKDLTVLTWSDFSNFGPFSQI
ncbi:MAG: hypothetical protein HZB76_02110 [Chlamydiae bacterium]|nr:hypothetical protein [Chlamydiota bacterium]